MTTRSKSQCSLLQGLVCAWFGVDISGESRNNVKRAIEPSRVFYVLYFLLELRISEAKDIDEDREGFKVSGSAQELFSAWWL